MLLSYGSRNRKDTRSGFNAQIETLFGVRMPSFQNERPSVIVLQERMHVEPFQLRAAVKEGQFYKESQTDYVAAKLFHQLRDRFSGPSRCKQIVNYQDPMALSHSIFMHFQGVLSILQII